MTELEQAFKDAVAALRIASPGHLLLADVAAFELHQSAKTANDYRQMIEWVQDATLSVRNEQAFEAEAEPVMVAGPFVAAESLEGKPKRARRSKNA